MIISTSVLKNNTNKETMYEDESLFLFGLECIQESDNQLRDILFGVSPVLLEGFGKQHQRKFNFITIITNIIKLFNEVITDLFKRFYAIIININYTDATISKYKNKIKEYSKDIKIKFPHYNYTNLDTSVPDPNLYLTFEQEFDKIQEDIKNLSENRSKQELLARLDTYYKELKHEVDNKYHNKIRAEIFNNGNVIRSFFTKLSDGISEEEYPTILFRYFRDGHDKKLNGEYIISNNDIHASLDRFLNVKNTIKQVDKQKNKLEIVSKKVENKLTKYPIKAYLPKGYESDKDIDFAIDKILHLKATQLSSNCNIYILAFSAKLEAIKEAVQTDKRILYKVIDEIIINED